jgi:flagellar hook-associated protein 1 FlgK
VGNTTVVDANNPRRLELQQVAGKTVVAVAGTARGLPETGGALGTMLGVVNTDVPEARARLDAVAKGLVDSVNALHRRGYSAAGEAADPTRADWSNADPALRGSRVDFFDASAGTATAATISLSAAVAADAGVVAAGYTRGGAGDNALALAVGALRDRPGVVGTQSIGAYYQASVSGVAAKVSDADRAATAAATLAQQSDTRRQSVSGVSTDEELIQLMRHQQAYVAASRLISVADEMTRELLSIVR